MDDQKTRFQSETRRRSRKQRGSGTRFANTARVREFSNNNSRNKTSKNRNNYNVSTKPNRSSVAKPIFKNAKVPLLEYPFTKEDSQIIGRLFEAHDTLEEMQIDVEKEFCIDLFGVEREVYDELKNKILSQVHVDLEIARQKTNNRELLKRFINRKVIIYSKLAISDFFSRLDIPETLKPNVIQRLRCNLLVSQLKLLLE